MSILGFIVIVLLLLVVYVKLDSGNHKVDKPDLTGNNDPLRKRYYSDENDKRL